MVKKRKLGDTSFTNCSKFQVEITFSIFALEKKIDIFVVLWYPNYFMTLDMKMMLEIKQIAIFCFFSRRNYLWKWSPLSGKEWSKTTEYMSKDKLIREVCENDKLKKITATKLMTLRELNKKRRKNREWQ